MGLRRQDLHAAANAYWLQGQLTPPHTEYLEPKDVIMWCNSSPVRKGDLSRLPLQLFRRLDQWKVRGTLMNL